MPNLSIEQLHIICRAVWDISGEGDNGEYCTSTDEETDAVIMVIIFEELAKIEEGKGIEE
jgi:hypothetical protein